MDSIESFITATHPANKRLIVNCDQLPDSIFGLFEEFLSEQPISISYFDESDSLFDVEGDVAILVEDGDIVAQTDLYDMVYGILTVNSDFYTTGTRNLSDVTLHSVITSLDEVPFRVRGFPQSDKEKMILIYMSRVIERLACESPSGTLRASFQHLSRLTAEDGTQRVYEAVSETDTDVHVYGVNDLDKTLSMDVTVHGGTSHEYRNSWFVIYTPDGTGVSHSPFDFKSAALVAYQMGPNDYKGFWTFSNSMVEEIEDYVVSSI